MQFNDASPRRNTALRECKQTSICKLKSGNMKGLVAKDQHILLEPKLNKMFTFINPIHLSMLHWRYNN